MYEFDMIMMSLVIFVPTAFALILMIPWVRGAEAMRWISLFGTAITLVLSICMFISYYSEVVQGQPVESTLLSTRVEKAFERTLQNEPPLSNDWIARYRWIPLGDRSTASGRLSAIPQGIQYFIGVDGISMPLILLTTVLSFLAMIASWNIERHVRGYCILFLLLETGMIGTFLALDFFLFYIFWEVMLLPMYFLIGVWGGPRREYAAIKFFLYTLFGSVLILIALLGFYFTDVRDFVDRGPILKDDAQAIKTTNSSLTDAEAERLALQQSDKPLNSFDLVLLQKVGNIAARKIKGEPIAIPGLELAKSHPETAGNVQNRLNPLYQSFFSPTFQIIMFLLLFVGFAIKVPVFPFHTWLPDAHVEAPTPISMILAGVLLKMGGYGIIRIAYPICPWAAEYLAMPICIFGIINIVYGAFAAMAQTDFKKLVAYSSVSHMGYVILGIAVWSATGRQYWSWAMNGAMFQMIAHGITSAGMFFLVGVIYDRAHHRNLDNFRGLYEPMPLYGGISAIIFFAAMGLPGMCGFVGEFMVVLGTWNYSQTLSILAALTVILTAAYILWTLQRVYLGQNPAYKDYPDISARELACITPLVVFSVLLGVMPNLLLSWMEPSVTALVNVLAHIGQ
jgi:NADH-quinone oxidoreductase subunit M